MISLHVAGVLTPAAVKDFYTDALRLALERQHVRIEAVPKELPRDLAPGRHFCAACRRVTDWYGDRIQKCTECGDRFPCARQGCAHQDCADSRKVWGSGDWTDIFEGLA
jgi:hypothetical protein